MRGVCGGEQVAVVVEKDDPVGKSSGSSSMFSRSSVSSIEDEEEDEDDELC